MAIGSTLPVGTVTFLFTDIEGSTRLVRELGDGWPRVLAVHDSVLRQAIESNDGHVVKSDGDSFFAVFQVASRGVEAAVWAQRGLAGADWPQGGPVRVRMGLHTGVGALGGADYVGLDVHRASRIADAAHGGQIVTSEQTAILAERELASELSLRDLGKYRLKDLGDPESIFQVDVEGMDSEFPILRTLDAIPNNLPQQVTAFIGREQQIAEAIELLQRARIVTLTGPGGTGKTRLSLQIAAEVAPHYEDGVFFVGLSTVTEPEVVPSVILNAFGLAASHGDDAPTDRLLEAMRNKNLLVVLDNFEQLIEAAPLVADMARVSSRSRLIVTSRAPLHVSGEQEVPVPPLGTPEDSPLEEAVESEGIRLLVDRALSVRPDFTVDESNLDAVKALVNRLDGLPLAIELVATRLRLFPAATILERLDARMLGSGSIDLPERQRTITNTIAWSYELLDTEHRSLFCRLSVFAGGASLEEIEKLCIRWELGIDLLEGLSELVGQSLLRSSVEDGQPRFRMLHVIREFAREQLDATSEAAQTRDAHLVLFTEKVEAAAAKILGRERLRLLNELERDHDNIRTALEWGLETGQADLVLRLSAATWRFWQARGHLHEAQRRLEEALALGGGDEVFRAKAIEALGGIRWWRGDIAGSVDSYREALEMQRGLDTPRELANALYNYGLAVGFHNSEFSETREMLAEARRIYDELGDDAGLGDVAWGMGNGYIFEEDYETAFNHYSEAAERYRAAGNHFGLGWSLFELGDLKRRAGELDESWRHLVKALASFAEHRDVSGVVLASAIAASVAFGMGDRHRAYRLSGGVDALRRKSGTDLVGIGLNITEGLEPESIAALAGDDRAVYHEGLAMGYEELVEYGMAGPVDEDAADPR